RLITTAPRVRTTPATRILPCHRLLWLPSRTCPGLFRQPRQEGPEQRASASQWTCRAECPRLPHRLSLLHHSLAIRKKTMPRRRRRVTRSRSLGIMLRLLLLRQQRHHHQWYPHLQCPPTPHPTHL